MIALGLTLVLACFTVPGSCASSDWPRSPEEAAVKAVTSGPGAVDRPAIDSNRDSERKGREQRGHNTEQGGEAGQIPRAGGEPVGTEGRAIFKNGHWLGILTIGAAILLYLGSLGIVASVNTPRMGWAAITYSTGIILALLTIYLLSH